MERSWSVDIAVDEQDGEDKVGQRKVESSVEMRGQELSFRQKEAAAMNSSACSSKLDMKSGAGQTLNSSFGPVHAPLSLSFLIK